MKRVLLYILLLFCWIKSTAQGVSASPGEYTTNLMRHDSIFDATTGKPIYITNGVAALASGAHSYLYLGTDGKCHGAGTNGNGELGIGNTTGQGTPQAISVDSLGNSITFIKLVCAGTANGWSSMGIKAADSSVWIWGNTERGARGNGTYGIAANTRPVQVTLPGGVKAIDILMGDICVVLASNGDVYTWGGEGISSYMQGQGASPNYRTPTKITLPAPALMIAGGSFWNYASLNNGDTWMWGGENYLNYQTFSSGTAMNVPRNITSNLGFTFPLQICANNESSYALMQDHSIRVWGGNACGTIGNGIELWYNYYCGYPVPYGTGSPPPSNTCSNPFYWNWDQGHGELQQILPVNPTPGCFNYKRIDITNALCFNAYFEMLDGRLACCGRNKQSLCYGVVPGNYINGAMQQYYPNSWDCPFVKYIDPFSVTTVYQSPSPDCLSGSPVVPSACATYTIPSHSPPTASFQVTSTGGKIYLNNTGSTDTRFIAYRIMKQTAGPATLDMGIQDAPTDTISTAQGSAIPVGTYTFQLTLKNDNWDSTKVSVSVQVLPPNTISIPAGSRLIIH